MWCVCVMRGVALYACLHVPRSTTCYAVAKGAKFSLEIEEEATEITKGMLAE
jgi:hypothetical protein